MDIELTAPHQTAYRTLIIDADPESARRIALILKSEGIDARIISDPDQIMPYLRDFRPEIILMDLAIAKYNGQSLVKTILSQDRHISTPIVFLSSTLTDEEREELNTQDSDLLSKRTDPLTLINTVMTKLQRIRDLPVEQTADKPVRTAIDREQFNAYLTATLYGRQAGEQINQAALMCIDLGNLSPLRETIGVPNTETVIGDFTLYVLDHLTSHERLSRLNDNTLVALLFQDDIESYVEDLHESIDSYASEIDSHCVKLDISIGITLLDGQDCRAQEILANTHTAVEIARQRTNGKRYHIFNLQKDNVITVGRTLEQKAELDEAIVANKFKLRFQPLISLQDASGEKYDAMVFRQTAEGQEVPHEPILSNASLCAVNSQIDKIILNQAFDFLVDDKKQKKKTILFMPLSAESILENELPEWMHLKLKSARLSGKRFVFTISEEVASTHLRETRLFINKVMKLSCRICLSLQHTGKHLDYLLDFLPHHFVKLGANFTHNISSSEDSLNYLTDFSLRMHKSARRAIAMHIENRASLSILKGQRIDFIHGNYLQLPLEKPDYDFSREIS